MNYLRVPAEVSLADIRAKSCSWSPGMYRQVMIPTSKVISVGELLANYENGMEVGSLAYVRQSDYAFIRTKALQDHSVLTQSKGDSIISITPQAYEKAVRNHPGRIVKDGDILYARGGAVGEVGIVHGCGTATISSHLLHLRFTDHPYYCFAFLKHPICKLQQQPKVKGAIHALDNFHIDTLLRCLVPFPHQPDAERVIRYVSALMEAIVDKEKMIRIKNSEIDSFIRLELESCQNKNACFLFLYPSVGEVRELGRLDAAMYSIAFKRKVFLIKNYFR